MLMSSWSLFSWDLANLAMISVTVSIPRSRWRSLFRKYHGAFYTVLRLIYYKAPSLKAGLACNLLLFLGLASAVFLGFQPCGTRDNILLPQFWNSSQLVAKVPASISAMKRIAQVYSKTLGFLCKAHCLRLPLSLVLVMWLLLGPHRKPLATALQFLCTCLLRPSRYSSRAIVYQRACL
jgi:hypothetical protein